jgi:hypothetical protein
MMSTKNALTIVAAPLLFLLTGLTPAGARSPRLAAYLPTAGQYPTGVHVLPVRTYADPGAVFGDTNAELSRQDGFVSGVSRTAFRGQFVMIVSLGQFRSVAGARHFAMRAHTDVVSNNHQVTRVLRRVGSGGARSVTGNCASCGPTAPTLGQVLFNRGSMAAVVWVQPAQPALMQRLATIIDTKLQQAHQQ